MKTSERSTSVVLSRRGSLLVGAAVSIFFARARDGVVHGQLPPPPGARGSASKPVVSDYEPFIRGLNAGKCIASVVGDEMTTGSWGHFGAFPLPPDLERAGQGAVLVHAWTTAR